MWSFSRLAVFHVDMKTAFAVFTALRAGLVQIGLTNRITYFHNPLYDGRQKNSRNLRLFIVLRVSHPASHFNHSFVLCSMNIDSACSLYQSW